MSKKKSENKNDAVIDISSESDCSDVKAFDTIPMSLGHTEHKSSNRIAPIFVRAKKICKKTSKCVTSRPDVAELDLSARQESNQSTFDQRLRDLQASNPTFPIKQVFTTLQKKAGLQGQNGPPTGEL